MKLKRGSFLFFVGCLILNNHSSLFTMEEPETEITKKQKIEDPLIAAIENNDILAIGKAIEAGADPNRKLITHNPLVWALQNKQYNLTLFLLAYGADPSITLDPGNITFDQLVDSLPGQNQQGKQKIKELLHSKQVQFFAAASRNLPEVARKLLNDVPALLNPFPNNRTLLHYAAFYANLVAIKLLIEYGIDIDAKDNEGKTALIKLIENKGLSQNQKIEALKTLLSFGPTLQYIYEHTRTDPNTGQIIITQIPFSALHYTQDPEILSILLNHGADVNYKDNEGRTVLIELLENRSLTKNQKIEALKTLLPFAPVLQYIYKQTAINPNTNQLITVREIPFSALHYTENPEILSLLLNHGADLNFKNAEGESALMHLLKISDPATIKIVEDALSTISSEEILNKDNKGNTLLHIVANQEDPEKLKLLLKRYPTIDVNVKNNKNQNPLLAVFANPFTIFNDKTLTLLELFLEAGIDVNAQDDDGNTLLHYATKNINFDTGLKFINLLKQAGASITIENNDGNTPYVYIQRVLKNLDNDIYMALSK